MSKSRSLLTGVQTTSRSIINPISTGSQQELQFGNEFVNVLRRIENDYVGKMARRKFLEIPDSMPAYLYLNDSMLTAISKQKNSNLRLLFEIARDGIDGARFSKTLFENNTELDLKVIMLNKKIDEILSGKNDRKAVANTSGQFTLKKTFKLAPLYSYYIHLYGMPAYGVGFDASKLSLLTNILRKYGINPFK